MGARVRLVEDDVQRVFEPARSRPAQFLVHAESASRHKKETHSSRPVEIVPALLLHSTTPLLRTSEQLLRPAGGNLGDSARSSGFSQFAGSQERRILTSLAPSDDARISHQRCGATSRYDLAPRPAAGTMALAPFTRSRRDQRAGRPAYSRGVSAAARCSVDLANGLSSASRCG